MIWNSMRASGWQQHFTLNDSENSSFVFFNGVKYPQRGPSRFCASVAMITAKELYQCYLNIAKCSREHSTVRLDLSFLCHFSSRLGSFLRFRVIFLLVILCYAISVTLKFFFFLYCEFFSLVFSNFGQLVLFGVTQHHRRKGKYFILIPFGWLQSIYNCIYLKVFIVT